MQTAECAIDIAAVQRQLQAEKLDGWLFYSFHGSDPVGAHILGLPADLHATRRWFYFIPATGKPRKLLHRIELNVLDTLPGDSLVYLGWRELENQLAAVLNGLRKVAMQYSPENAIPYISRVDAGTIELVRKCGAEVVSSANLVQHFEAVLTSAQKETHIRAVELLRSIVMDAFAKIAATIKAGNETDEYRIQQFVSERMSALGLITNSPCIVGVNEHSSLPHYQPNERQFAPIRKGDFVLIDLWAKQRSPSDAVYGDITWTAFAGESIPSRYAEVFDVVAGGRDAAVQFIKEAVHSNRRIEGWMVDDVTRNYISERGFGKHFIHRTGHSIGMEVHGNGANIDNLETRDRRQLVARTCFSIEPGVYLPEFGIRSEIDVYIDADEVMVAGQPIQSAVIPLMML